MHGTKIKIYEQYLALSTPETTRTNFYEIQTTAVENLSSVHVLPEQLLTVLAFRCIRT